MFATASQLETEEDLVNQCLCKLQDGLKVTPSEASDALKQYSRFKAEIHRLQMRLERPSRTPKQGSSLYFQEKTFKDRTDKIIATKEKEISVLKQALNEATTRLNALVGTQSFDVDDNRSDLTDPNKPTRLAEDYRAIFDKEWETAYEELDIVLDEPKILIYLGKVTWLAYQFCKEITEQQLTDLMQKEIEIIRIMSKPSFEEMERRKPLVADGIQPRKFERDETFNLLKQYRRCLARTSVPGVKQIFLTLMSRSPPTEGGTISDGVRLYLLKVVELTYLMCIQEPPMHLEWVRFGDILDSDKFKPYTDAGTKIVGTIWPAVLLHENGSVMSRGVVDVMRSQHYGLKTFNKR